MRYLTGRVSQILARFDLKQRILERSRVKSDLEAHVVRGRTIPVGELTYQFTNASDRIKGQQYKIELSDDKPSSFLEHAVHFSFAVVVGLLAAVAGSSIHYSEKYTDRWNVGWLFSHTKHLMPDALNNTLKLCLHMTVSTFLSGLVVGYLVNKYAPEW